MPERIQIRLNIDFPAARKFRPGRLCRWKNAPGRNCRIAAEFAGLARQLLPHWLKCEERVSRKTRPFPKKRGGIFMPPLPSVL
jgi:hypothetical protein